MITTYKCDGNGINRYRDLMKKERKKKTTKKKEKKKSLNAYGSLFKHLRNEIMT